MIPPINYFGWQDLIRAWSDRPCILLFNYHIQERLLVSYKEDEQHFWSGDNKTSFYVNGTVCKNPYSFCNVSVKPFYSSFLR